MKSYGKVYSTMKDNGKRSGRQNKCESCMYFDFDEEYDGYICTVSLDEDEAVDFLTEKSNDCPYYRLYDEYKSVRKQN